MSQDIKQRAVSMVLFCALFTLLPTMVKNAEYAVKESLPTTFWFEYLSIKPDKSNFKIGEDIVFVSHNIKYRTSNLFWEDVLYCKRSGNGEFKYYSIYTSSKNDVQAGEREISKWVYRGTVPDYPSICKLESYIEHRDRSGVIKSQSVKGEEFYIGLE